jgi:glycosyltransferase involved in cell wall biosynthesis
MDKTIKMNPKVTVIIATKNGSSYIHRAIDSVIAQTLSEWECIVINDASTDSTPEILSQYSTKDSRIQVLHNSRSAGPGISRNTAVSHAKGQYLAFLDDDDIWNDDEKLHKQISYLDANPGVAIVGVQTALFTNETTGKITRIQSPISPQEIHRAILWKNPFFTSGVMVRTRTFNEFGGFGHGYVAEDYELWLKICSKYQGANIDSSIVYSVRNTGLTRSKKKAMAWTVLGLIRQNKGLYPGYGSAILKAYARLSLAYFKP